MEPIQTRPKTADWIAYALGAFAVLVFGATLPVTHLALVEFSPWLLTFLRAGIATVMAIAILVLLGRPLRHRDEPVLFVGGLLLVYAFPGFMAIAMQTVPASHGGVILGFLPLATAFIARLLAQETPSPRFWVFTTAGFLVVAAYILLQEDAEGNSGLSAGDAWLLLAGISTSLGYVIFGKLSRQTAGWEIIARALVLNSPITLAGIVWLLDSDSMDVSATGLMSLAYLGMFSMFLGFCAWNAALARGGISRIGQLQLMQVFATIAISAVLLGEAIDLLTLVVASVVTLLIAASRTG